MIILVDPTEQPRITRYKIVMTGEGHKLVIGITDGRDLVFKIDFRPVQRFLRWPILIPACLKISDWSSSHPTLVPI